MCHGMVCTPMQHASKVCVLNSFLFVWPWLLSLKSYSPSKERLKHFLTLFHGKLHMLQPNCREWRNSIFPMLQIYPSSVNCAYGPWCINYQLPLNFWVTKKRNWKRYMFFTIHELLVIYLNWKLCVCMQKLQIISKVDSAGARHQWVK